MTTIKKRSALGKIFKTKKDQGTQTEAEQSPLASGSWNGDKKRPRTKTMKKLQWENHRERINGYYFSLEGENRVCRTRGVDNEGTLGLTGGFFFQENGQEGAYYCFVGIYKDELVIHIRVYIETSAGDLIPTKEGCCLNVGEYKKLIELAPDCLERWQEDGKGQTLRHPLSQESDWFLLIGENDEGYIRIAVKLLLATNKSGEFETLNKGAVLTTAQFGRFCDQLAKISKAVEDMRGYLKPE